MQSAQNHSPSVPWCIWIYTTNKKEAGTDAQVVLVLYGQNGKSDVIKLKSKSDAFESGKCDEFKCDISDVGIPFKLRVAHDNTKLFASWHLDRIEMENLNTRKRYLFRCGRWLSKSEDDKQTIRELSAEGPGIPRPLPVVKYMVDVYTGNKSGGGTDANVFINIFGDYGDTGDRPLEHSLKNKNKFEKNQVDNFIVEAVSLQQIRKIRIGHDGSGLGAGWFLDKVVIRQEDQRFPPVTFLCNRWLAANEDDRRIVRELTTNDVTPHLEKKPVVEVAPPHFEKKPPVEVVHHFEKIIYNVKIKTGDVFEAGTDADVHFKMFGKKGDSNTVRLSTGDTQEKRFERGHINSFALECDDLGKIQHIIIGHNGKNAGARWFLDWIEIDVPMRGEFYKFICNRWLDKKEGDSDIELDLSPSDVVKKVSVIPYEVIVYTGDKSGAGTDANVFLTIYGEHEYSGEHELTKSKTNINKFEQNQEDIFQVKAPPLGKLKKIKIRHDDSGASSAWYLERIDIVDPETEHVYHFICQKWLAVDKDDRIISREIPVFDNKAPRLPVPRDNVPPPPGDFYLETKPKSTTYTINVVTSDKYGSGTNAKVYIIIFGINNNTGKIPLTTSKTFKDPFENGHTDVFIIDAIDVGKPTKIRIGHDNSGMLSDWLLERVEINLPKVDHPLVFPCGKWLSKSKGDSQLEVELFPKSPSTDVHTQHVPYEIKVYTSKVSNAGTDANVHIELYGIGKKTSEKMLCGKTDRKGKFQMGSIDTFMLELEDVGDNIQKIRIGHDNTGYGPGWHLDRVEIRRVIKGQTTPTFVFPCNRWFAKDEDDKQIVRELACTHDPVSSSGKVPYEIEVVTSDKQNAGTSEDGWIIIEGNKKRSVRIYFKNTQYEKILRTGQTDIFEAECPPLGELHRVILGHEERNEYQYKSHEGQKAMWHVAYIIVTDSSTHTKFEFPIHQWISINNNGDVFNCASKQTVSVSQERHRRPVNYKIIVHTGDASGAGTDSNVSIILYGVLGQTGHRPLKQKGRNLFERNQTDEFLIECLELGKLTKLHIQHDDTLSASDWFLNKVEVINMDTHETILFPCNRWLSKKHDDHAIERDLLPAHAS